jgi:hypothetical protein
LAVVTLPSGIVVAATPGEFNGPMRLIETVSPALQPEPCTGMELFQMKTKGCSPLAVWIPPDIETVGCGSASLRNKPAVIRARAETRNSARAVRFSLCFVRSQKASALAN